MGLVLSMCQHKKRDDQDVTIHRDCTPTILSTTDASPTLSSDTIQCSAISRAPITTITSHNQYYLPHQQQVQGYADRPLVSTPYYSPCRRENHVAHRRATNPYVAHAYNYMNAVAPPSIHTTNDGRDTLVSSSGDLFSETPMPEAAPPYSDDRFRMASTMTSTMTPNCTQRVSEFNSDDRSRLIKRSASAPMDMFLIDISHEYIPLGQPVSMNIRHLLLDTLQNHHAKASAPLRIQPSAVTTYAHENLLDYIPYVCERYPNVTVESDRSTRNMLHIRVPSEFSRSLDVLT